MSARMLRMIFWAIFCLLLVCFFGFVSFALNIERQQTMLDHHADGMIVLTGGSDRIADAINLFSQGHADRMLITGVNPGIARAEIARLNPKYRELIDCCVDLGYEALNTSGNAKEARRWADQNGISRSVIVVTSNYHMPRALAELHFVMPELEFIPYFVISPLIRDDNWWQSPQAIRLIASEYIKFLLVSIRIQLVKIWIDAKEMITRFSNSPVVPS